VARAAEDADARDCGHVIRQALQERLMSVTAETVRQLRERTGAGMMECKRALVETGGDLDSAAELMRKQGLAKADKKASRIAAEGVIATAASADGHAAVLVEVNCETDFVARGDDFTAFASQVATAALEGKPANVEALAALKVSSGESVEDKRRALIAKIGENITVRRFERIESPGALGSYLHGTRIGTLVALEGGDAALAKDLAMHVAASNPLYLAASDVPEADHAKERDIRVAMLKNDEKNKGKPDNILVKIVEGGMNKWLGEITLLGQPFIKDDKLTVEKLLAANKARVLGYARLEVGAGIEKKQDDFVAEVMSQAGLAKKDEEKKDEEKEKGPK
jgi:elongation factor Ts